MRVFKSEYFATPEDIRKTEQELAIKFGEPCVIFPNTITAIEQNVSYVCDGYACPKCHPEHCHHTTDIRHAVNFIETYDGRYIEKKEERH